VAFHYIERRPAAPLRPFVECFWAVSDDDARERPPDRIVPDGCPELIVHRGDVFSRLHEGRLRLQPRAFLAGALTRPWTILSGPRLETVGVRLRPGAAAALLRVPLGEATDVETPLDELVGRRGRSFTEAVCGAPSLDAALGTAESIVTGWLGVGGDRPASAAVAALLASRGRRPVADIARHLGWSLRRLERVFRDEVGLPPKLFARIVRLNSALASLPEEGRVDIVDVALACGYFDQSHLLRDFRLLAGASPRRSRPPADGLASRLTRPARLRSLLVGE